MGRMRRQRRYKACDPFAKKDPSKEKKVDLPPGKEADDIHFKETKSFLDKQNGIDRAMSLGKRKKKKNDVHSNRKDIIQNVGKKLTKGKETKDTTGGAAATQTKQGPHETKKQYFARLDQNVNNAINQSMMQTKILRKKRKLHLKAREEKKKEQKRKKAGEKDENEKGTKSDVKFGEFAAEPPSLTAASSNKYKDLKLVAVMKKNEEGSEKKKNKLKPVSEEERQRVIDAYRLMKKRNSLMGKT